MRLIIFSIAAVVAAGAVRAEIQTFHFTSHDAVQSLIVGGAEFSGRADTAAVALTHFDPLQHVQQAYPLWTDGEERGFNLVHNADGVTAMSVDTIHALLEPVSIAAETNGLLITTTALGADRAVLLDNLQLTLPGEPPIAINDVATMSDGQSWMLITTDHPLANGFILSGAATFGWNDGLASPADQWFEIMPVVVPEPAGVLLLVAGIVVLAYRRR